MSLVTWVVIGLLSGIVIRLAGPIIAGPLLPEDKRQALAGFHIESAMVWADRAVVGAYETGQLFWTPTEYIVEIPSDKATLGGERHDWGDPNGLTGWLANKPFACVLANRNVKFTPREADIAARGRREEERDQLVQHIQYNTQDGSGEFTAMLEDTTIPSELEAVDIRGAKHAFGGSARPTTVESTDTLIEKSQAVFDSMNAVEAMFFIMCMGVGAGIVYLGQTQFTGAGGGGSIIDTINLTLIPLEVLLT